MMTAGRADAGAAKGRLPPEVIQVIVRRQYAAMRQCYENGLLRDPKLEGRVATRFVIDLDGTVSYVSKASSTLPDPKVVQCVMDVFHELCFPNPDGGIVGVVYPIMFSPGD
jgi:hypothetical protein